MMSSSVDWRRVTDIKKFEDSFREALADTLKEIKEKYRFGKFEIDEVTTSWIIQSIGIQDRKPDITVFARNQPFLIIECKRAIEYSVEDDFAIGQAYSYALLAKNEGYKVDYVATAVPYYIAIFKVPEDLESCANWDAIKKREYNRAFKRELYLRAERDLFVLSLDYTHVSIKERFCEVLGKLIEGKEEIKPEPFRYRVIKYLKSFVDFISSESKDLVKHYINNNLDEFSKLRKRRGVSLSYEQIAKEFAYSIMNRILFYKILEKSWKIDKLRPLYGKGVNGIKVRDGETYYRALKKIFKRAVEVTGDFEPVFILDFHDKLTLPSYAGILKAVDGLIQYLDGIGLERIGDVIGYVYEEIINPEERHQLGEFYTPHGVAELIAKWCIRSQSDIVLDPGSGSGTFLVEAYRRLYEINTGRKLEGFAEEDIHKQIIEQLYAIDIDEFACHLSAINISARNVLHPSSNLNIIHSDLFNPEFKPPYKVKAYYRVITPKGENVREIIIPVVDCIVGNPPYTRWVEIPERTQEYIRQRLGDLMRKYGLTPQVRRGLEPPIYVFWVMNAERFLKDGGRLGMIISNLWLQTDYGVKFANYLLDHFRVCAVIDIPLRIFQALITTTVILLEKEKDKEERENNDVVFVRLSSTIEDIEADKILKAIEEKKHDKFSVHVYKQKELSREKKWIRYLFGIEEVERSDKIAELEELFEITRGNSLYSYLASKREIKGTVDLGSNKFFYFSPSKAKDWNIPEEYLYPAVTSSRQLKWFTFKEKDWLSLRSSDTDCYFFICHKSRDELPDSVKKYIKWGETECFLNIRRSRTRGQIKTANQAEASKAREKSKHFFGWYDLGGVKPAQILAIRQARYKTRFALCEFPVVTYDAILRFFPKVELTREQLKTLLAYFNSSFTQFYIEIEGRYIALGPIALEISQAERMPVLDPRKLSDEEVERLSTLFDRLESKAREIGGATKREQIEELKPVIHEIDREIGNILGLSDLDIYEIQNTVDQLIERRIVASGKVKRHVIKGEEEIPELEESEENYENKSQLALNSFL